MLKGGIHLSLLIGPAVPVPAPAEVVNALTGVQVTRAAGELSGFQLAFEFSVDSVLNTLLVLVGEVGPIVRVILVATVKGTPHVLVDGVITNVQVTPDVMSGKSTLTLTGKDLTAVMEKLDTSGLPYPAMPVEARVAFILAKYAVFGIVPMVIPTILSDVPIPVEKIPTHQGNDLEYINLLAREAGYVFYIEPGPTPGMNLAYWGPEIKTGVPQPALSVNMDAFTNVEALNFQFNNEQRTLPVVMIHNELTKIPIPVPVPDVGLLNPPLGLVPPVPARIEPLRDTAKLNPIRAALLGVSAASRSADVVTATGSLDVLRYGHVLNARGLVGVRGTGHAFDGLYFVKKVSHKIQRGEFKTDFVLTRNALVSNVPNVSV